MLSRSSVACCSCFWDPLIMEIVSVKVWHTPLLPSSFLLSFLSFSIMLRLQFKVDVMPCSWAKSLPVEASSKENCFMKASRASERTKEQIKPELNLSQIFFFICRGCYFPKSLWLERSILTHYFHLLCEFTLILPVCLFAVSIKHQIDTQSYPHVNSSFFSHSLTLYCVVLLV